ncbi:MAG TPA: hypothetical protein VF460_04545 [Burkholderiales bacterium]
MLDPAGNLSAAPTPTGHSRPAWPATALCALLLPAAQVAADATRFGVDAEYGHYTNVNRAALKNEEKSDDSVTLEAYAARSFLLSERSGIVVRGGLRGKEFFDFGDLSSLGLTGRAAYRFQPSPGFTSPWLELAATIETLSFRDSDIRDGYIVSAAASIGKYLTDRIRVEGGAGYEQRKASEGAVYDLSNAKLWGALDYKLTSSMTFYGSATWLTGEQVFTLFNTAAWSGLYAHGKASASDPVFAPAFGGAAPMAYKVDADTTSLELGANIALKGNQALDFGVSWFDSKADQGGGSYDGTTFRAGYLYRFR